MSTNAAIDNWYWLPTEPLPEALCSIETYRLLAMDKTFITFGSPESDNCYIYNTEKHKMELVNLENSFPQNMKDMDPLNTHRVIDISEIDDDNDNNNNNEYKRYFIFGNNGYGTDWMYHAIYNISFWKLVKAIKKKKSRVKS